MFASRLIGGRNATTGRSCLTVAQIALYCACFSITVQCSYAHPVVGVFPGEESSDDSSALLLAALGGGTPLAGDSGTGAPAATPTAVILYTGTSTAGDLRNGQATARLGADLHCQTGRPTFSPNDSCTNIRAFTSLAGGDEIRDMPVNYGVPIDLPVQGPTGGAAVQIANNWTELLDTGTPLAMNLQTAGIANFRWRSFSNNDGSLHTFNCSGGTSTAGTARYGDRDTTATAWISDTNTVCGDTYRLLCICY